MFANEDFSFLIAHGMYLYAKKQIPSRLYNKLIKLCKKNKCDASNVVAVGDGANDLDMLLSSGLGGAFEGKDILKQMISTQLTFSDLSGILYLQGYYSSEFVN